MKRISDEIRNNIVFLLEQGLSTRQIEGQIGVSRSTVNRLRVKFREGIEMSRGGRPAKLSPTDKRKLVRLVAMGKADTALQLAKELKSGTNLECSTETVRRALKRAGCKCVVKQKSRDYCRGICANVSTLL